MLHEMSLIVSLVPFLWLAYKPSTHRGGLGRWNFATFGMDGGDLAARPPKLLRSEHDIGTWLFFCSALGPLGNLGSRSKTIDQVGHTLTSTIRSDQLARRLIAGNWRAASCLGLSCALHLATPQKNRVDFNLWHVTQLYSEDTRHIVALPHSSMLPLIDTESLLFRFADPISALLLPHQKQTLPHNFFFPLRRVCLVSLPWIITSRVLIVPSAG